MFKSFWNERPGLHYLIEAARGLAYATTADEITNVVGRAVSHGETSGTDALVGLLFYLDSAVIFRGQSSTRPLQAVRMERMGNRRFQ